MTPDTASAIGGLGCWFAFAMTALRLPLGKIGRLLAPLIIPGMLGATWLMAIHLHWWAAAVLVGVGWLVSTVHGAARRHLRPSYLYSAQPVFGMAGVVLVATGWVLHFLA